MYIYSETNLPLKQKNYHITAINGSIRLMEPILPAPTTSENRMIKADSGWREIFYFVTVCSCVFPGNMLNRLTIATPVHACSTLHFLRLSVICTTPRTSRYPFPGKPKNSSLQGLGFYTYV